MTHPNYTPAIKRCPCYTMPCHWSYAILNYTCCSTFIVQFILISEYTLIGSVCPNLKSPNRDKLVIVPERPVASFPVLSLRQHLRSLATMAPIASSPMETVDQLVAANRVMVFSKTTCPFCTKIKNLFEQLQVKIEVLELDQTGECQNNV